jgi:hypothetical protein
LAWALVNFVKLFLVCVLFAWGANAVKAASFDIGTAGLCDQAAVKASRSKGVPLDILLAISRTETGRITHSGLQPWPWAVNMEGVGRWFATLDEARSYVFSHYKNGARSFDVGCFQINYKWHGEAFRSINDMFDPEIGATYAAEFLISLYREFGSWPAAAGAYHSRNLALAKDYAAKFSEIRRNLPKNPDIPSALLIQAGRARDLLGREISESIGSRPPADATAVALGSLFPIGRQANANRQPFVVVR